MVLPTFSDIQAAHELIKPYIHRTPVLTSQSINAMMGCELFFKCENLQKVGAFKFRGATNAVFSLSNEEAAKGVGDPIPQEITQLHLRWQPGCAELQLTL